MMEDLRVIHFRQAENGTPLTFSTQQAQRMRARLMEGAIVAPSAPVGRPGHKR